MTFKDKEKEIKEYLEKCGAKSFNCGDCGGVVVATMGMESACFDVATLPVPIAHIGS